MYGTVMIATLRGSAEEVQSAFDDWLVVRAPQVRGFQDAGVLFGDDGRTIVNWARFDSRDDYARLADDPDQAAWHRSRLQPLLEGEPRWVDGTWLTLAPPVVR